MALQCVKLPHKGCGACCALPVCQHRVLPSMFLCDFEVDLCPLQDNNAQYPAHNSDQSSNSCQRGANAHIVEF